MERLKIAQYIALGATICSIVGFIILAVNYGLIGSWLLMIGFLAGIVANIIVGFGRAVKMAVSIAKWGWYVVPFPYDLMTVFVAFFIAITVLFFIPIIPVRKAYKESKKHIDFSSENNSNNGE